MNQHSATYIGKDEQLKGKKALVFHVPGAVLLTAQFDDMRLVKNGITLGIGWHPFHRQDFQIHRDDI